MYNHPTMEPKPLRREYADMSNEMIEVIATDDLLAEAVEEVGDLAAEGREYVYQYDNMVHTQHDQNVIFQLYQPLETVNGTFLCRICMELGETIEFETKADYAHHRYKVHGSYNLPSGQTERNFIQIPHSQECPLKCISERLLISASLKHKLPHVRMMKEGAQCPAHISFRIDPKTGHVDAFYQLFHYGHAREYRDSNEDGSEFDCDSMPNRPIDVVFPESPDHPADRPMQYVQIDLLSADSCVYVNTIYSHILIITDIKTGFIFAKPIPEAGPRQLLIRILTDIFLQFGVPEGFSCSHSVTLIRDVISALNNIFRVNMKEILYDTPDYNVFLETLYDHASFELQSKHRWVEMVQFTTMILNQSGKKSPFERMFNRKPYNLSGQKIPPWLQGEDISVDSEDEHIDVELDEQDEEPTTSDDRFASAPPRYNAGDKVYMFQIAVNFHLNESSRISSDRTFRDGFRAGRSPHRRCCGIWIPHLGEATCFLICMDILVQLTGKIVHIFLIESTFRKARLHWPSESSVSAWVSPYDVLPTTHDLLVIPEEERQRVASALLCSCDGGEYGTPCPLFRSYLCGNGMAKACCLNSRKTCDYHLECADGDDTYYVSRSNLRLMDLHFSHLSNGIGITTKLCSRGQPRVKNSAKQVSIRNVFRRKIPSLAPENTSTTTIRDDAVEMPVLTSESIPVVSTIVIENEDRTFIPALSKRTDSGASSAKEVVTGHVKSRPKNSEPSELTYRDKPPPPKRSRRTTEAESPEQKPLQASFGFPARRCYHYFQNNHICPVLHCREIYASMTVLRKHLVIDHKMPIEMHFRTFANIGEFERFRHLVEILCNCRFMMHTKQPHNKRQIMHCSKSEHKIILQSRRHKLPHVRMMKEGAQCPAHISFRIDPKTGHVDAFYQLFHYGHAREYRDSNEDGSEFDCDSMVRFLVYYNIS
ncbi:hypothetical protein COOONC_04524 [Cooperia oncophora]